MGFFDRKSTTQSFSDESVTNVGSSDFEGIGAASNTGNVSVVTTDGGAIAGAFDFASEVSKRATSSLEGATKSALDFGASAIDSIDSATFGALKSAGQAQAAAYDFAGGSGQSAFQIASDAIAAVMSGSKQAQQAVLSAAGESIKYANTTAAERTSNTALYVGAGVAVLLVLLVVMKK